MLSFAKQYSREICRPGHAGIPRGDKRQDRLQKRAAGRSYNWRQERIMSRILDRGTHKLMRKQSTTSTTSSEPHPGNVGRKPYVKPSSTERSPHYFPSRPMCWTTHVIKPKISTIGRFQPLQRAGVKLWEEKPPRVPTPRSAVLTSAR